jgi:hypothetical protein
MFACCTATFLVSERSLTSICALRQCKTLANSKVCASAKAAPVQKLRQCKNSTVLGANIITSSTWSSQVYLFETARMVAFATTNAKSPQFEQIGGLQGMIGQVLG